MDYKKAKAQFFTDFPEFRGTSTVDKLRTTEYSRLDVKGHVYLDYTGGGLYARSQLAQHMALLESEVYSNPHSANPTSTLSTDLCQRSRNSVLKFFNASSEEYHVIFTMNATGALKIVGESYPFDEFSRVVFTEDNHNSVSGMREFAIRKGAKVHYVRSQADLRVSTDDIESALSQDKGTNSLFAYPAQSNFSGVQHSLDWIELAHRKGWDVLVDCAAFVPTNTLDLSKYSPDYVSVSFYKMFGYPTGIGCLIVRKPAFDKLNKPWFGGGTVWAALAVGASSAHVLYNDFQRFEDGTIDYLSVPAVEIGLRYLETIGMDTIHLRASCLTSWLLKQLSAMPFVRIYGPKENVMRGGTISLRVYGTDGEPFDERIVTDIASKAGISLRNGCYCNPGAAFGAELVHVDVEAKCRELGTKIEDIYEGLISFEDAFDHVGIYRKSLFIRVSVGIATNFHDCYKFVQLIAGFKGHSSKDFGEIKISRRPRKGHEIQVTGREKNVLSVDLRFRRMTVA